MADQGYHLELGRAFADAWQAGELPPTWSATANGGRGAPAFLLYPPLFPLLTASWIRLLAPVPEALRWAALSAAAFNLAAAYWAARARLSRPRAALASGVALLLPGVTFVALGRGMFPNFLALGWIALAAGAAQRALDGRGRRFLGLLAAAGAGLILTHTPSAYLAALAAAVFLSIRPRSKRIAGALAAGVTALVLTAWFWLPMLEVAGQAQTNYLAEAHPYRQSLWPHQGIASTAFDCDWAYLNESAAILALAQLILAATLIRRGGPGEIVGGLAVVAACSAAAGVWPTGEWLAYLPFYEKVQFCWRWQPLLALWCAFAFAALPARALFLPGAVLAAVVALFAPLALPSNRPPSEKADLASNLIEMRPRGAPRDLYPPGPAGLAEVVSGECQVTPLRIQPALRLYSVRAKTPCAVRVRTFHFPGWTATLGGSPVPIRREPSTALQLLDIPAGERLLEVRYRKPN